MAFREVGRELEGRDTIEGEWAGRVTGLGDQRVEIAMMRTPDGHGRLELSRLSSQLHPRGLKGFSSDSPMNSAERNTKTAEYTPRPAVLAFASADRLKLQTHEHRPAF